MIPPAFLQRVRALLGAEFEAFAAALAEPPVLGLRVNLLKTDASSFAATSGSCLVPVPWCPEGFSLSDAERPGKHPWHAAGVYYLQEPTAMAAVIALDPQPGEQVLDLCAAPGGKATHIVSLMQNAGLLVANDPHLARAQSLAGNLERWGARNAVVTLESPGRLAHRLPGFFDRVLVDAPCSEEGMFRRSPSAWAAWSPQAVDGCAARQVRILHAASDAVRPGGTIVYSTCTFSPEENEQVIARFLATHPGFELKNPPTLQGSAPGRPDWSAEVPTRADAHLERCMRLWPHRVRGDGHFLAILRRSDAQGTDPAIARVSKVRGSQTPDLQAFWRSTLAGDPPSRLTITGTHVYAPPEGCPDLAGLRVLRPGWWLGTLKPGRFEPSHALALALTAQDCQRRVDLLAAAPECLHYLKGEPIVSGGPNGWALVTVDGFPLGWGKRTAGVLKNAYPKGLRWV